MTCFDFFVRFGHRPSLLPFPSVLGSHEDYHCLSSVERYDEGNNTWEAVASMSSERSCAGVAALGGHLYAVGGKDTEGISLSSVERYHDGKDQWEAVASMSSERDLLGAASTYSSCPRSSP